MMAFVMVVLLMVMKMKMMKSLLLIRMNIVI